MRFTCVISIVFCLILCCCGRWDADNHFAHEKQKRDHKLHQAQLARTQQAVVNIAKIREVAFAGVRKGMTAQELQEVVGYRFDPIAKITSGGETWERRRYLLYHLVTARWGSFSEESNMCDQETELFTITLVDGVVRAVDTVQ